MALSEERPDEAQIRPGASAVRVTCPHCGRLLDVVLLLAATPPAAAGTAGRVKDLGRTLLSAAQELRFLHGAAKDGAPTSDRPWRTILPAVLGIVVIAGLLIWLGRPSGLPDGAYGAPGAIGQVEPVAAREPEQSADVAAIRDTLARYNRAESEAAAILSVEPLLPYLDPGGPFAERRRAELAERRRLGAPHRSALVRWSVGQITVTGSSATAVTQETWGNQEAGAVAPEQATVRVRYTLRWDAAAGRWLIVESEQLAL